MNAFWTYVGQILNFLIFVGILHYLLYKPVSRIMKRRRDEMESDLREAEEKREEADGIRRQTEQSARELEDKRESVLREAREQAEREREEMINQAEQTGRDRLRRFRRVMQQERDDLLEKVSDDLRETIVKVAASVLGDASAQLTDRSLERLEKLLDGFSDEEANRARQVLADNGAVHVRAAGGLDGKQEKRLRSLIEERLSVRDFNIESERDDSLVAGIEVTIGHLQLEAHWRSTIDEALQERDAIAGGAAEGTEGPVSADEGTSRKNSGESGGRG